MAMPQDPYIDSNIGQPPNLLSFVFLTRQSLRNLTMQAVGTIFNWFFGNRLAYKSDIQRALSIWMLWWTFSAPIFIVALRKFQSVHDKTVLLSAFLVKNCSAARSMTFAGGTMLWIPTRGLLAWR